MIKNRKTEKKYKEYYWHSNDISYAFEQTKSSKDGLSTENANERLLRDGKNQLPKKKAKSIFAIALHEILNPITLLLLFACLTSYFIGEIIDSIVILFIIMLDLVIGIVQEKRAERMVQSLNDMIKVNVKVLRNGEKMQIDSKKLCIGDIVFLESGDKVPADMRIVDCSNLTVNEATLTGESMNCEKNLQTLEQNVLLADKKNMVFAGTSVISGRAMCVVVGIGINTEIGKIAHNLNQVQDEKTPLDVRINKFSKQITIGVLIAAIIIFAVLYFQGYEISEIFLLVVALSVSAIPEGLPLAVTMALTIGSNRMGKKNVIVKTLKSVESLGSCTVIATDKTGTLTLNEQTAKIIVLPNGEQYDVGGSGYNNIGEVVSKTNYDIKYAKQIGELGELNNEAKLYQHEAGFTNFGDSIDVAFLALARKVGADISNCEILQRIPYESENKYSAVFYKENDKYYCTVKGSLETILSFSRKMHIDNKLVKLDTEAINQQHEKLASHGYRVIAIAHGEIEQQEIYNNKTIENLNFMGMVGFIDPIRPETLSAVNNCFVAGIKVIMITGDHPLTAYAIAKEIKIAKNKTEITTGSEVEKFYQMGVRSFDKFVKSKKVFSRVTPTDKLHIVESLKRQGEFVAVTGDGVNDTPAIKSAHIGIAMGSGSDVAKETADMIIADDNFNSIVEGIKEGRNAYSNIRKVTYMLISTGFAEILFFLLSIILNLPVPLIAIQLLWLNVITDGLQDLALSFEKAENGIMEEKPRNTKESLFSRSLLTEVLISGLFIGLLVFGVWMYFIKNGSNIIYARSIIMALMVFLQNFQALNCRSETQSLFKIPAFSNWFFAVSIIGTTGLQVLIMEVDMFARWLSLTPVSYWQVFIQVMLALTIIVIMEIYKLIYRHTTQKRTSKHKATA